ncbi:MAG: HdeD family acid-resistance protein [Methyloceanibacter sp.]
MASSNPTLSDMQAAVKDTVRLHWQLFLAQGVIMLILGVLAVIWPQISTIAVDVYVGWLFLLSGIVGLASMFLAQNVQAFLWMLLTAALSLFVGIVLLWHPVEGAASLTLVLIAFFVVEGVFQIVASLSYRDIFPSQWGWMLASGIVDLILAALIIKGWPSTATWALGLIVGINLITSGAAITMVALAGKALVQTVAKAAR